MKLLREPLLHFLFAGALLFGAYQWLSRSIPTPNTAGAIRIGEGEIRWLQETFANQWRRGPTTEELNGLVATLLEEELLAREARELGLDQNDTIVRRRLAQKLSFLVEDTSQLPDPGDDELRRFFASQTERYRTEPLVSFRQIFFSAERRSQPDADARAALTFASAAGAQDETLPEGDRLLLGASFADVDLPAVSNLFGSEFASSIFVLPPGPWSGPIRSAFGIHLVQVVKLRQAEPRQFEEVRDTVINDWQRKRGNEMKQAYLAKLRDKFGVVIDDSVRPVVERRPATRTTP